MLTMKKWLALSMAEAMGFFFILLAIKAARHRHHAHRCGKGGINIDERLKESKAALDKAAAHFQSIFDHLKNMKP